MRKMLLSVLLVSSQAFAYQAYFADGVVRRFQDTGKIYDQEILRLGGSASFLNKAVWGKVDRIENKTFGPDTAMDLGGLYRYGFASTTLGAGYSTDFRLRANRLFLGEQRFHLMNERLTPFMAVLREAYHGPNRSVYNFYRGGTAYTLNPSWNLSMHLQKITNDVETLNLKKQGYGYQFVALYTKPTWSAQAGLIRNCLGGNSRCQGSRDLYEEFLTNGQWLFKTNWYLRAGYSLISQSSRFVEPFSGQTSNSKRAYSQLYSLGIMMIIP